MSLDPRTLEQTAAAFRALDLTAENERIAEIEAEIATIETAIGRADARRDEISALLHPRGPSAGAPVNTAPGATLADALLTLDPEEAVAAQPKEEDLRAQFKDLGDGMGELRRRAEKLRQEVPAVQRQADRKAFEAARPVAEALAEEARVAGIRLVEVFAAMKAIVSATGSNPPMWNEIEAAKEALTVNGGRGGLLRMTGADVPAPAEITSLLANLQGKGAAVRLTKRGPYYGGY